MIRFCLVGFGRWGRVYYQTIHRLNFCRVDCIVVNNNRPNFDLVNKTPIYYNLNKAIEERKFDAVIIAAPPEKHLYLAKICLLNNIPVLIEKPFTCSFEEANSLNEIIHSSGVLCMVGFQHLFSSNYKSLKENINSNEENITVYSEGIGDGPKRNSLSVFRDWGSHEISLALDFFGQIPYESYVERLADKSVDDIFNTSYYIRLKFSKGRIFNAIFGNTSEIKRKTLIAYSDKKLIYYNGTDLSNSIIISCGQIMNPFSLLTKGTLPVDSMLIEFCRLVMSGNKYSDTVKVALQTVKLLDQFENN